MSWIKKYENFREYRQIYESTPSDNVRKALDLLKRGAYSAGTNTDLLEQAIELLQSEDDFNELQDYMKYYPTEFGVWSGYSSLQALLNGELEGDNTDTAQKIANKLDCIGVKMSYRLNGGTFFPRSIIVPNKDTSALPYTYFGRCTNGGSTSTGGTGCGYTKQQLEAYKKLKNNQGEYVFTRFDETDKIYYKSNIGYSNKWYCVFFWEKYDGTSNCDFTLDSREWIERASTNRDCYSYKRGNLELAGFPGTHSGGPTIFLKVNGGNKFEKVLYSDDQVKNWPKKPQSGDSSPEPSGGSIPEEPDPVSSEGSNNSEPTKKTGCDMPSSKCIPTGKNIEIVKNIQKALSEVEDGKYKGPLGNFGPNGDGIDGQYGCATLAAVKQFQENNNINPADGIYGPDTAKKLSELVGRQVPPYCSTSNTTSTTTATPDTSPSQTPTEPQKKAEPQVKAEPQAKAQNKPQQKEEKEKDVDGAEIYGRLLRDGELRKRGLGGNTIVYKGEDLPEDEKRALIDYMKQTGFRISKDKFNNRPGEKIVFRRE